MNCQTRQRLQRIVREEGVPDSGRIHCMPIGGDQRDHVQAAGDFQQTLSVGISDRSTFEAPPKSDRRMAQERRPREGGNLLVSGVDFERMMLPRESGTGCSKRLATA